MELSKKRSLGEKLFVLFVILVFVSPMIFVKSSIDITLIYFILSAGIGQSVGKEILRNLNINKIKIASSQSTRYTDFGVLICTLIYFAFLIFLYSNILKAHFLATLFLIQFSSYSILYLGFKAIIYKRTAFWTGFITKRSAVISGIYRLVFSFIILIIGILIKLGYIILV